MLKANLDAAKYIPLPVGFKICFARLRCKICEAFKPLFQTGLTKRVANLLEALRLEAYAPDQPIQSDRIHANYLRQVIVQ